jgi:hypothetical protein
MRQYISEKQRLEIGIRANFVCEYCLIHEADGFFEHQIDHIISIKHGGGNHNDNLAYTCVFCNRNKGSDIGSVLLPEIVFVRLFNPRLDDWNEHFELRGALINAKTDIGKVTLKVLKFNTKERLAERQSLQQVGRYPK